jgi:hypothetical protein
MRKPLLFLAFLLVTPAVIAQHFSTEIVAGANFTFLQNSHHSIQYGDHYYTGGKITSIQPQPGAQLCLAFHRIAPERVSFYGGFGISTNACYVNYEGHWKSGQLFQDVYSRVMRFDNRWLYAFSELRFSSPGKPLEFGMGINSGLSLRRMGYYSYDVYHRNDPNRTDTLYSYRNWQRFGGIGEVQLIGSVTYTWLPNNSPIRLGLRTGFGLTQFNFELPGQLMNKVVLVMREHIIELNFSAAISRPPKKIQS